LANKSGNPGILAAAAMLGTGGPNPSDENENGLNTTRSRNVRETTIGANANDRRQVYSVAREFQVDRRRFEDYIEDMKKMEGRGGRDNYTIPELRELARNFIDEGNR